MMSEFERTMRDVLTSSATELFADYSVACRSTEEAAEQTQQLCGILGFTGDQLCGSVIIVASPEALSATNPSPDVAITRWLSELTNQVVGRFKNELLRRGVDVTMSVPVVLSATRMEPVLQNPIAPIHLAVAAGSLSIWLELEGSVVLQAPTDVDFPREGEALMF
jgi:CheY-specific phosphatase CheX